MTDPGVIESAVSGPVGTSVTDAEAAAQAALRGTADFAEGVAAWGERRPPRFIGS